MRGIGTFRKVFGEANSVRPARIFRASSYSGSVIISGFFVQGLPDLYRRQSSGRLSAVRMHNDALDPVYEFERPVTTVRQRLRSLAPTAIEDGVGGGYAGGWRCILASHDADENADRGSGVAACEGTNLEKCPCLAHLGFPVGRSGALIWYGISGIGDRFTPRAKGNRRKIRLQVVPFGTRDELDDVDAHENSSDIAMTRRPTNASEIR
jgi:hypothetical protein